MRMVNVFVTTVGALCEDLFNRAQARGFCNLGAFCHSPRLHRPHSAQIERQADEFEFGFCLFQPPHAELAKSQNVLDPAVGRLGNPLAFAVVKLALCGLEFGGHRHRVRVTPGIPGLGQYLALAPPAQ